MHPETGELLDAKKNSLRSVNHEKAEKDARFDGYFCLITSEMDDDARKIREVYGACWKIEGSFRSMKSDWLARPVFVHTPAHLGAHFLIGFTALLIVRLIQYAMGKTKEQGTWVETLSFSDLDETAEDYKLIQRTFGTDD